MGAASISKLRSLRVIDALGHFVTLCLPIATVAGPAPIDIAGILLAVLFLARSAIAREWQWLGARWVQLVLLLWLYLCVRNAFLPGWDAFGRAASFVRYPLLAAALAYWTLALPRTQPWLVRMLIAAVAFLAIDSFLQYATGHDLFGRPALLHEGARRLTGPYSAPRVGITLVWLFFPALLAAYAPGTRRSFAALGLATLAALAIFISGERMAFLLCLVGFGLMALLVKKARPWLVAIAVLGVLGGYALVQFNPAVRARQIGHTSDQIQGFWNTVYGRSWRAGSEIIRDYPAFGVGSKQFQRVCGEARYGATDTWNVVQRCPMHPHNMLLEWGVEAGATGLALWLSLLGSWLWLIWRHRAQWWQQPLATGLLIALLIKLFPAAVTPSQFVAWSAVPFWWLVGWLLARLHSALPENKSP